MRIVVIRFSSIGDIVLTSPVVRCIKKKYPWAKLAYVTKKSFAPLVQHNPHIDDFFYLEEDLKPLIAEIKAWKPDFIVDLHHNLRTFLIKRQVSCPSGSFPKLNVQKFLKVNFGINCLPDLHIVDRYFFAMEKIGVNNDELGLEMHLPKDIRLPESLPPKFIAVAVGAQFATKTYPQNLMAEALKNLPLPIVLLGGKQEAAKADFIEKNLSGQEVYQWCGKTDLIQSAAVVQMAQLLITHDTGLMHIGAAFKRKMVSLWGNTIPEFGMYAYYGSAHQVESVALEVKGLSCRPCSKIGHAKCPKKHFKCMNDIKPAQVQKAVLQLLD